MKKQITLLLILLFLQCLAVTTLLAQAGLIAWYPFNGNALDETGNGHNGTVSGATLSNDRFGNPMSAYSFDGINDKIVIGKEPNFPSWDTYAVSLWFLNDGGGNQGNGYGQKILSKAQFYTDFHLSVLNNSDYYHGQLSWWSAQGGFNSVVDTSHNYGDNKWHHVVLNKNSPGNGDLWVDGVLKNSSNELQAVFNNQDLVIGFTTHSDGYQQKYFSGKIDDIRIYNRVLSESEISDLYTGSYCHEPTGLKVFHVSDTCAVLTWNATGTDVSKLQVRYRALGDAAWTKQTKNPGRNRMYINGLMANTTYQWQLRSLCTEETSGWVKGPDFTTAASLNPITKAQVYPNPAKNAVSINYTAQKNGKYVFEMTDISGNGLLRKEANALPGANRITLDISRFFKGNYFINIIKPDMTREKIQLSKE